MESLQTNTVSASFPPLPGQAQVQNHAPSFQLVKHPCPSARPSSQLYVLTVQLLDALEVILRQLEVLRVHPLVEGGHDSTGVAGMFQAQRVPQLVHGHQEKVVPCRERHCQQGGMGHPCARDALPWDQSNLRHPEEMLHLPCRHTSPRHNQTLPSPTTLSPQPPASAHQTHPCSPASRAHPSRSACPHPSPGRGNRHEPKIPRRHRKGNCPRGSRRQKAP